MQFLKRWLQKNDDRLDEYLRELERLPQAEITPSYIVKFSRPLRAVFNHATRQGRITVPEAREYLHLPTEQAKRVIDLIVEKGFLSPASPSDGELIYATHLDVRTRGREERLPKDILNKLDDL